MSGIRQNGVMYMSAEVIAIVIAAASLLVTLGGTVVAGFAWMIKRQERTVRQGG